MMPARTGGVRAQQVWLMLVAAMLAGFDLAAKALADAHLAGRGVDLGLLQLRLAHNPGVAFSLGDRLPSWLVITATAAITAAIGAYAWRTAPTAGRLTRLAWAAILAGAAANVLDRTSDGVVTDYLHTGWWPTFNLADTLLTVGVAALIVVNLLHGTESADAAPASGAASAVGVDGAERP